MADRTASELASYAAAVIDGEPLSLRSVLDHVAARDGLDFVEDAARTAIVRSEAAVRGLEVSDEELQAAADGQRRLHGLHRADATHSWLAGRGLSVTAWERALEEDVLASKLSELVVSGDVKPYFDEHRAGFDRATLSQIVLADEGIAAELQLVILEEDEDFGALAQRYSIDDQTRRAGGYVGSVMRRELPAHVAAGVFEATEGEVLAPLAIGPCWHVIRVESIDPAVLNPENRATVVSLLFREWLDRQVAERVDFRLLADLAAQRR